MIGCTKLLCGTATVSDALKFGRDGRRLPVNMLQFSDSNRPLVVWNMTNRCNLRCKHCYISAEDQDCSSELSTEEGKALLADLAELGTPVVLFSGGEPLLRRDLYELGRYAAERHLRPIISTNGTLITPEMAGRIKKAGFQYVGVSLDGARAVHDDFRQAEGAFDRAIAGIRNCLAAGLRAGVRFTVHKGNYQDLPMLLDYLVEQRIPRFCMYHLVYAGRGKEIVQEDLSVEERRQTLDFLLARTEEYHRKGVELEILTVDNHADGVYIYQKVCREQPERAAEVRTLLEMHGGCSAGKKFADVDATGNVHPCQFWGHVSLGNVRERRFSEIWQDTSNPLLARLRDIPSNVNGRCGQCRQVDICGGCRIRAEVVYGDTWAEDPACYLTDEERAFDPTQEEN